MPPFAFGVNTVPPLTDPTVIMQRADEVNTVQRMLTDARTSAVILAGDAGVGKSTLAALLYHRLLLAQQAGMPAPHSLIWLSLNSYTTLVDVIAAILSNLRLLEPDLFLLKAEQQIALLLDALRRPEENALVVLDQFEALLPSETNQGVPPQSDLPLLLELLQAELGGSRILLTSYTPPFDQETMEQTRMRSYLVSRISIPEGVALLHQRGVKGTPEELSLVWQRCGGHAFALVLFSTLAYISGIAPGHLLLAPEYQALWSDEVILHMLVLLYRHLNPMQLLLLRALSLFDEPVPAQAIVMTITGKDAATSNADSSYARFERELQLLTQLALVQRVSSPTQGEHYILHPLLARFVQEHYLEGADRLLNGGFGASLGVSGPLSPLHNNPEAQQVALAAGHTQVAGYYYALAQEQCPPKARRTSVQEVVPIIAAVRHLCLGWHRQQACDLLFSEGLHESLVRWGAWSTLVGLYTLVLSPSGTLARRDEALVSSHLGMLYGRMGDYQQSQLYFEQASTLQHELNDTYGQAVTLANQGELYRMRGELEQAHANFERAIALMRQREASLGRQDEQDVHLQCIVLHNMGLLYHSAKEYQHALSCYIRALRLTYNSQEQYDKGIILTNLGTLLYEQGHQQEALAVLLAALQLRRTLQDPGVVLLGRFLMTLEQKMGPDNYQQLCQTAMNTQQQVFAQLMQTA